MVRKLNTKILKGLTLIIIVWLFGVVAIALLGLNSGIGLEGMSAIKPLHEYSSVEKLAENWLKNKKIIK